jgi:AsmA protein
VKVKLLPLLRGQVAVDTVILTGFELALARNARGVTNWDDLLAAPTKPADKPAPAEKPAAATALPALAVNGVEIRKAMITWHDQTSGARYALRNLDLKTSALAPKLPVDLALGFDVESGKPPVRSRLDLKTRVAFDLEKQTLDVSSLTLALAGLKLTANVHGSKLLDAPSFSGKIEVAAFDARALLRTLGIAYEPAGKGALTRVGLATQFAASTQDVALKDLALALDDSRLTGSLAIRNLTKPAYRADLALDHIDVDRYVPAAAAGGTGKATPAPPGAAAAVIPVETLRTLDAQAKFRVGRLKAYGAQMTDAVVTVKAQGGVVQIGPNQAKLYSGSYQGTDTIDVRGATPRLAFDEQLSGVQLAPLLKDMVGIDKFTGAANINTKLTAEGASVAAIKQSLAGNAQFNVQHGTIQGIDLKRLNDAIETARKQRKVDALGDVAPKPGDQTRFTRLGGTARAQGGVLQNDDLLIDAPGLARVTGKGSADLVKESMKYVLTLGAVPVKIEGPFASLRYTPDLSALAKKEAEKAIEKEAEKLFDRLKKKR